VRSEASGTNRDELLIGLSFGLIFGLALHKAGVTDYDVVLRTLLLRDMLVLKVMMTAVIVGAIGIYALRAMGLVRLHIREAAVGSNVIGGLIFGLGFALLGYCPGTAVGAVAAGHLDAFVGGILGMLAGSLLFAQVYPHLKWLFKLGYIGDKTLWQILSVNHWAVVLPVCGVLVVLMWYLETIGR
jgi:uncharacterized protein